MKIQGNNYPNRQSHRLKNYDYSQRGLYFITICCQNKECLFGYIDNKTMFLNDAGKMIGRWYVEIENKYPNVKCLEHIVMPNHFHCLLHITTQTETAIGDVVRWFKTMTTNDYIKGVKENNWRRFDQKLWQRDFYDIIVRDSNMHFNIVEYINNNPARWGDDKFMV